MPGLTRTKVSAALITALTLGASMHAFAQEGTPDDPRLFTPGQLTVATSDPAYPPWVLDNDPASGEGFEAALVYAIAAELGFERENVVWVRETFEQAIAPGAKSYDFGIQQISVTEARAQVATFSEVYYQPEKAVVALPGSPVSQATSFAELREARWGVAVGTTDLSYVETILGITDAAVYDDQVGVFQALQGGQIDATVVALPTALFVTAVQVPDTAITAILPSDENDLGHGLIFAQGSDLVEWVNTAIATLDANGTIDALVAQYLIADPDLPVINE